VICDDAGNCEKQSFCSEYIFINGGYKFNAKYELKKCHGIFGVTSTDYISITEYVKMATRWAKENCKMPKAKNK